MNRGLTESTQSLPASIEQAPCSTQAYLESFYKFCTLLGGTTADAMCPILEVSACPPSCLLVSTSSGGSSAN